MNPVSTRARVLLLSMIGFSFCLVVFGSMTRLRQYSHDAFFYMDTARNIVAGEGIAYRTHDIPEAERLEDLRAPLPMVIWTPLYPILIAAVHATGLDVADAALLVSVCAYGSVLLFMYLLARETHGDAIALLATAFLTVSGSLTFVATYAWSETTAIAFAALCMWVVAREWRIPPQPRWMLLGAGLAAGLSFASRYAMLPVVGFAGLALLDVKERKLTLQRWTLLSTGFLLAAVPIIARNLVHTGHAMGWAHPYSDRGFIENFFQLGAMFTVYLFSEYLFPPMLQFFVVWLLILGFLFVLLIPRYRRKISAARRHCLSTAWWQGNRRVLTLWSLGYLGYLLVYRTVYWVDPLGPRLGSPGMVPFIVPAAAYMCCAFGLTGRAVVRWAGVFALLGIVLGLRVAGLPPRSDFAAEAAHSERFAWLAKNTSERDLVIGDHLEAIRFYFPERVVINFYNKPLMDPPLDYERLMAVVDRHCGRYDRVFFTIEDWENEQIREERGPLVADIIENKWKESYPALSLVARVKGAYVFRIECAASSGSAPEP